MGSKATEGWSRSDRRTLAIYYGVAIMMLAHAVAFALFSGIAWDRPWLPVFWGGKAGWLSILYTCVGPVALLWVASQWKQGRILKPALGHLTLAISFLWLGFFALIQRSQWILVVCHLGIGCSYLMLYLDSRKEHVKGEAAKATVPTEGA